MYCTYGRIYSFQTIIDIDLSHTPLYSLLAQLPPALSLLPAADQILTPDRTRTHKKIRNRSSHSLCPENFTSSFCLYLFRTLRLATSICTSSSAILLQTLCSTVTPKILSKTTKQLILCKTLLDALRSGNDYITNSFSALLSRIIPTLYNIESLVRSREFHTSTITLYCTIFHMIDTDNNDRIRCKKLTIKT